jgi:NADH-quinone oxidoreductase subunit A
MPQLVGYLVLFVIVGVGFILVHLLAGKLLRPAKPDSEKLTIYECGEPTIGSAWIQFDVRFYVVALLFVIFDVEVAFFFPWAVVFGKANALANTQLSQETRLELTNELVPADRNPPPQQKISASVASDLAWLAFIDIAVFFGVLLVGFAYLWKRGDLDWVRSVAAERAAAPPADRAVLAKPQEKVLVGSGSM